MQMNFFISNFKRKSPFVVALIAAATLLVTLDIVITAYVHFKTSRDRFIDSKDSKFLHLSLQKNQEPFDAIFIGSSFTKNHISTSVFAEHGLHVYNLGISGRLLADFPSMVKSARAAGTRWIVVNVSVDELFVPPSSNFVHTADLFPLIASTSSVKALANHISAYLLSLHTLHYHRESIYQQILTILKRLTPTSKSSDGIGNVVSNYEDQEKVGFDCKVFKIDTHSKMKVLTCTNGDGVQLGYLDHKSDNKMLSFEVNKVNVESLALLNSVIGLAHNKTQLIVVLQPIWGREVHFDAEALRALIHAPVIDLTAAVFSDRDWCDQGHFNIFGRKKYSTLLADQLLSHISVSR